MTDLTLSKIGQFQPCDISEVFDESTPGVFTPRFGAAYQILDRQLNWLVAYGSPAIVEGKYSEGLLQKIHGPPSAAYVAEGLSFAVLFPKGFTIFQGITRPTLRSIITSSDDPGFRSLKARYEAMPYDPALDQGEKVTTLVHETSEPRILALRKDEVVGTHIHRDSPRPLQIAPGVYLDI